MGSPPPENIEIDENGRRFLVDVRTGHKTGFYLDQRENREIIGDWFRWDEQAAEREVLNAFAYTGGFAVYALGGLARRVVNVDTSAEALKLARRNIALNGYALDDDDFVEGDVFSVLRYWRDQERHFDMIILDPPKFAHSARQVENAARGYKDINLLAFQLLRQGGVLATFSCSGAISSDLFQKIVFAAAVDARCDAQIVRWLAQASDRGRAHFSRGSLSEGIAVPRLEVSDTVRFFALGGKLGNLLAGLAPANAAGGPSSRGWCRVHAALMIAHGACPAQNLERDARADARLPPRHAEHTQVARRTLENERLRLVLRQVFVQHHRPAGVRGILRSRYTFFGRRWRTMR